MNIADSHTDVALEATEYDLGPCELCGCSLEQHERLELYCDDLEREIYLASCALVRSWELDDPRDRWRHTGEPRPKAASDVPSKPPHRTPQSTIDAFWHVVGLCNPGRLTVWLDDHPKDSPFLLKLLEGK